MRQVITSPLLRQYASRLESGGGRIELLTKLGSQTLFREVIDLTKFPAEPDGQLVELRAIWDRKRTGGAAVFDALNDGVQEKCVEDLLQALQALVLSCA